MGEPDEGLGEAAEMERYGALQHEFLHLGGYELESRGGGRSSRASA